MRFTPILLFGRAKENQDLLIAQDEYINFLKNIKDVKTKIRLIFQTKGILENGLLALKISVVIVVRNPAGLHKPVTFIPVSFSVMIFW